MHAGFKQIQEDEVKAPHEKIAWMFEVDARAFQFSSPFYDPYDFAVDVDGMDSNERSSYLYSFPIELKECFRKPFPSNMENYGGLF